MITPPTAPSPGKPVSASFFARLIAWVKSGQLIEGPNYRLRRTPNGTALDFKTSSRSSSSRLPGFFEVKIKTDENGDKKVTFDYPYYRVGTHIYTITGDLDTDPAEGFYALAIVLSGAGPSATVEHYDTLGEMVAAGASPDVSVCPLYEFGEDGTPIRDLRNIPTAPVQEF